MMSLETQFKELLKERMKARDAAAVNVIRMVRSRILERKKKEGTEGEADDTVVIEVISSYVKQMRKSLKEYEKVGESASKHIADLQFEIAYLEPMLPKKLDSEATLELVRRIQEQEGISDPKLSGKLIGAVMRKHGSEVEAALVRAAVERLLAR
jgi:uncharacterized protein YqeY